MSQQITRNELKLAANLVSTKLKRQLYPDEINLLKKFYSELRREVPDKVSATAEMFFNDTRPKLPDPMTNSEPFEEYRQAVLGFAEGEKHYAKKVISTGEIEKLRIVEGDVLCPDPNPYSAKGLQCQTCGGAGGGAGGPSGLGQNSLLCSLEKIRHLIEHERVNFQDISIRKSYIALDSYLRQVSADTSPFSKIEFEVQLITSQATNTSINTYKELERVIDVKVGKFRIPLVTPNSNRFHKVRLAIMELFPLRYNLTSQPGYHFEFTAETDGSYVYLTPVEEFNRIIEFYPIPLLSKITLLFYDPYQVITFAPDRDVYTVNPTNPAFLTSVTGTPNLLVTGDQVLISGFKSPNQQLNNLINTYQFVTFIGPDSFTIPVDATSLGAPVSGANVFYSDRRIDVPLEFSCLE